MNPFIPNSFDSLMNQMNSLIHQSNPFQNKFGCLIPSCLSRHNGSYVLRCRTVICPTMPGGCPTMPAAEGPPSALAAFEAARRAPSAVLHSISGAAPAGRMISLCLLACDKSVLPDWQMNVWLTRLVSCLCCRTAAVAEPIRASIPSPPPPPRPPGRSGQPLVRSELLRKFGPSRLGLTD